MVFVDWNIVVARDVQERMRARTVQMRDLLDQLEQTSQRTLAEWDGESKQAYYHAKAEWDAGARQAQEVFDRKIRTWMLMTDRIEGGDQDGARVLGR
jgi:uncharacterized protein YukE